MLRFEAISASLFSRPEHRIYIGQGCQRVLVGVQWRVVKSSGILVKPDQLSSPLLTQLLCWKRMDCALHFCPVAA